MEVDIGMLGCASKLLWHEVYKNYIDIILSKKDKTGIILCKNFDDIHIELNDIFYKRSWTAALLEPKTETELTESIKLSKLWAYKKYYNCSYSTEVEEELNKFD